MLTNLRDYEIDRKGYIFTLLVYLLRLILAQARE